MGVRIKHWSFTILLYVFFLFLIVQSNNLFASNVINILDVGAKGDGVTDDTNSIQRALNIISLKGGGTVIIPTVSSHYKISETLFIGSNTRLEFQDSFLKLYDYTSIGTVLINHEGSTNITIVNPKLDGNNIFAGGTGENGISFIHGGYGRVIGGIIKNFRSGNIAFKLGGKGIQVENRSVDDFVVDGTKIYNSTFALSTLFNINENKKNNTGIKVTYKNIYAENCSGFSLIQQVDGLKESSTNHSVSIENFVSNNCGFNDGVFQFSRARGFRLLNGIVTGKTLVESIFRGRHSEGFISNIKIFQPARSIIDLRPGIHIQATTKSESNQYFLKLYNAYTYLLYSTPDYTYSFRELFNSSITVNSYAKYKKEIILPQAIFHNSVLVFNHISKADSSYVESKVGGLLDLYQE